METPATREAVWAESGDVTTPSTGEQQAGFVAGKPSRRKTNWLLNWLDNAVQWVLEQGYAVASEVATDLSDLHSAITDETSDAVDAAIGDVSSEAPVNTLTPDDGTIGYTYTTRFPGSAVKCHYFRLTFASGGGPIRTAEITLSGASAFAVGADNVIVSSGWDIKGPADTARPDVRGYVTGNQTFKVVAVDIDDAYAMIVEGVVQGH